MSQLAAAQGLYGETHSQRKLELKW